MFNSKSFAIGIQLIAAISVSSCSYIKSHFPDKEKEYQYTTEIAPLTLPNDMQNTEELTSPAAEKSSRSYSLLPSSKENSASAMNAVTPNSTALPETPAAPQTDAVSATSPSEQPAAAVAISEQEPMQQAAAITVELVKTENDHRLRINAPLKQTWRIIDKALSRKQIEVTKRDQEEGSFTVLYSTKERSQADGSLWDELKFMFKGFDSDEQEFMLALVTDSKSTDVTMHNAKQEPVNNEYSLSLLTVLENTIKADLADNK